jgi:hypothetical protein
VFKIACFAVFLVLLTIGFAVCERTSSRLSPPSLHRMLSNTKIISKDNLIPVVLQKLKDPPPPPTPPTAEQKEYHRQIEAQIQAYRLEAQQSQDQMTGKVILMREIAALPGETEAEARARVERERQKETPD